LFSTKPSKGVINLPNFSSFPSTSIDHFQFSSVSPYLISLSPTRYIALLSLFSIDEEREISLLGFFYGNVKNNNIKLRKR
jgi:hypothetical protein